MTPDTHQKYVGVREKELLTRQRYPASARIRCGPCGCNGNLVAACYSTRHKNGTVIAESPKPHNQRYQDPNGRLMVA